MLGSSVLDVAIGLMFLYLLLSLLVTGINELIETWLKNRARDLEVGLKELLEGDSKLLTDLYNHRMLFGLFRGRYGAPGVQLPSYIPSRSFALALMDLICPATAQTGGGSGWPSGADGATLDRPDGAPAAPPVAPPAGLAELRKVLLNCRATPGGVVPKDLAQSLLALVDAAGNDAVQVRKNIEDWFNGTMDRVSGWYKRRMQWVTAVVGLGLAVFLNADTFAIADSLTRAPALQASIAAAAEEYAKVHRPPADGAPQQDGEQKGSEANAGGGKAANPRPTPAKSPPTPKEVAKSINEVQGYGWPLGWNSEDQRSMPSNRFELDKVPAWLLKFCGWVVTAFAIMLGAPFWFDMLNKIIVIRSTVKPKEKSPDEPPVDRG